MASKRSSRSSRKPRSSRGARRGYTTGSRRHGDTAIPSTKQKPEGRLLFEAERERAVLRNLLDHRERVLDWAAGGPRYAGPLTPDESKLLTQLGKKFKYDPEFVEALQFFQFKPAHTRSKRR